MIPDIGCYLENVSADMLGENLNAIGRVPIRIFRSYLTDDEDISLATLIKKLGRAANQRNPPVQKASEALRLDDLRYMLGSQEYLTLEWFEKQPLDILFVAFLPYPGWQRLLHSLWMMYLRTDISYLYGPKHMQRHISPIYNEFQMHLICAHQECCEGRDKRPC